MKKYVLLKNGDVKVVTFDDDGQVEDEKGKDISAKLASKQVRDSIYDNSEKSIIKQDSSFGNNNETIETYSNLYKNESIYATEFEMLTGYRLGGSRKEKFDVQEIFSFLGDIIADIAFIETIVEVNKILQGENNVEENYSFRFGNYTIPSLDIISEYIFKVLNYPKEKVSLTERFVSFFAGFNLWLKPDNILDLDELLKEVSGGLGSEFNSLYDLVPKVAFKVPLLDIALSIAILGIENLITFSNSQDKRMKLLFNKFKMEREWKNNYLYKSKGKGTLSKDLDLPKIEDNVNLVELDYYFFRFYIERIHVGSKLVKYQLKRKTPLPLRTKESPFTRVGSSRFQNILKHEINSDKKYNWSSENTKTNGKIHEQSTRLRSLPQGLMLHDDIIETIILNSNLNEKDSVLSIGDDLLQNFYKAKDKEKRLPSKLVQEIENTLEAEYMPFYLHDVRTNEIISMHAFIDNIADSFSPEYTTTSGFGRIDDVRSYVKTNRQINLTFKIVSTSQSDHDLMWYQVNKIVSMVYPQWSDAFPAFKTDDNDNKTFANFKYPFSQVPTSSPLVRLRVGDVIKSNYSRTSLSRLHGLTSFANPNKMTKNVKINNKKTEVTDKSIVFEKGSDEHILLPGMYRDNAFSGENFLDSVSDFDMGYFNIKKPVKVKNIGSSFSIGKSFVSKVKVIEENHPAKDKVLTVDVRSIINKKSMYKLEQEDTTSTTTDVIPKPKKDIKMDNMSLGDTNKIMSPVDSEGRQNNPITKAYESGMSRGLAGFITNLDISYNEFTWETSRVGSKAPMMVSVTMAFAPIHDIPPGLDHNGMMRAPIYNVGRINNEIFGDPHDGDNGLNSGRRETLKYLKKFIKE